MNVHPHLVSSASTYRIASIEAPIPLRKLLKVCFVNECVLSFRQENCRQLEVSTSTAATRHSTATTVKPTTATAVVTAAARTVIVVRR